MRFALLQAWNRGRLPPPEASLDADSWKAAHPPALDTEAKSQMANLFPLPPSQREMLAIHCALHQNG